MGFMLSASYACALTLFIVSKTASQISNSPGHHEGYLVNALYTTISIFPFAVFSRVRLV